MAPGTLALLLLIGLLAGFVSGLIGIGGGIIIVPMLVYFVMVDQKTAQGTTLFMFILPIAALSVYNYYTAGYVNIKFALIMALTFLVGSYFGSKTAVTIDTKLVRQIFAVSIILIGIRMLWNK